MLSKIILKLYKLFKAIEKPNLLRLFRQEGFPHIYEKLDTAWFKSFNIDVVLDVGANRGQFTKTISALVPSARIYSFEPLPSCFKHLKEFADSNTRVTAFNCAIGDSSGILSFQENDFPQSSSFLQMADAHKESFPYTKNTKSLDVEVMRLDDVVKDLDLGNSLFIKVDVQGYEDKVLKGGGETFKKAKIILLEVSFASLYEGEPLFDDIYNMCRVLGFNCAGVIDQLPDPNTGKILQADMIFVNKNFLREQ
jgi:FkbM family methyltransferase